MVVPFILQGYCKKSISALQHTTKLIISSFSAEVTVDTNVDTFLAALGACDSFWFLSFLCFWHHRYSQFIHIFAYFWCVQLNHFVIVYIILHILPCRINKYFWLFFLWTYLRIKANYWACAVFLSKISHSRNFQFCQLGFRMLNSYCLCSFLNLLMNTLNKEHKRQRGIFISEWNPCIFIYLIENDLKSKDKIKSHSISRNILILLLWSLINASV